MSPADQEKYNARIKALEEAYAPEITGLEQQIAGLPQQFEAQKSALQQAKENAFRDITKTASRGGMFFTGFTPREEARYLGEKYLPGLQMLGQQETSARQGLLGQIAGLRGQIKTGALSYMDQLEALRRAEEENARNRAAAASAGFGGLDLSLPPTETPPTGPTKVDKATFDAAVQKASQPIADSMAKIFQSKNRAEIKKFVDFYNTQLARTNLAPNARKSLENQYNILKAVAKQYNYDLTRLQPSRAEAIMANPVVNRLTLTPSEYVNQIKTNINNVKKAYNWMFGAR